MATSKVLQLPSPAQLPETPERVSQGELSLLLTARARLRQLEEQVEEYESSIKARLESGAEVEPGDHTAKLVESFRANIAWKQKAVELAERLGLNGAAWAQNVLAHTGKTRTVSLEVY